MKFLSYCWMSVHQLLTAICWLSCAVPDQVTAVPVNHHHWWSIMDVTVCCTPAGTYSWMCPITKPGSQDLDIGKKKGERNSVKH